MGKTGRKGEMNIYTRIRKVINFDKWKEKIGRKNGRKKFLDEVTTHFIYGAAPGAPPVKIIYILCYVIIYNILFFVNFFYWFFIDNVMLY